MKKKTESLAEHTWLKVGGPAEIAVPETKQELIELLADCHSQNRPYRILGNGSNLLVTDEGVDELVVKTTEACTGIEFDGSSAVVGASVMIPQFINECVQRDLGGYEYLYSVPGTIGGAIFMNAGRGKNHQSTIADHLISVEVIDEGTVRHILVEDIDLDHRYSSFQEHEDLVILSAEFDLPTQSSDEGQEKVRKRMQKANERERSKPNAGSVFKTGARLPLHKIPPNGLSIGDARFVATNRICNDGEASFNDMYRLIALAKLLHRIAPNFETPEVEWEIWQ